MFESRHEKILPLRLFVRRMSACFTIALALVVFALGIGVLGYHFIADFSWIDALLNASMILTGMGPVHPLHSNTAKLFASAYALFSGLIFISIMALLLSPVVHRVMHKFHISEEDLEDDDDRPVPTEQKR
jgi:hypothetical protein